MLIKMRSTAASPDTVLQAGKTYQVEENFAKELVKGQYAEALEAESPKVEEIQPQEQKPGKKK